MNLSRDRALADAIFTGDQYGAITLRQSGDRTANAGVNRKLGVKRLPCAVNGCPGAHRVHFCNFCGFRSNARSKTRSLPVNPSHH